MLGELQGRAPVADGEVGRLEGAVGALLELALERARVHVVDQVIGTRAELHGEAILARASCAFCESSPPPSGRRRVSSEVAVPAAKASASRMEPAKKALVRFMRFPLVWTGGRLTAPNPARPCSYRNSAVSVS